MHLRNLLTLAIASSLTAGTLHLTVTDENGKRTPARVYLTAPDGKPVLPAAMIVYDNVRPDGQKEQHFVPRDGAAEIELPASRYSLVVERGKEYTPYEGALDIPASGRLNHVVKLERWTNMSTNGWYSGDMHFHRPLSDAATLIQAEDLNVAIPISRWRRGARELSSDPRLVQFLARAGTGAVVRVAPDRLFTVLNEELEPSNAALLVSRMGRVRSGLNYPMADYGRRLVDRGALVDSEKATQLELPVHAALGACNLVGLANNHFWRSGYYSGPWGAWPDELLREYTPDCAGFALAGFEMYYAMLNTGFPLKLSAGSASGVHPVPPGWSRVYVHVEGDLSARSWFDSLAAGRSFVTTGPMLLLTVDGHEPGDDVRSVDFPRQVRATVRMLSPWPASKAELIVNGSVHSVPLKADGPNTWSGSLSVALKTTAWIAARWLEAGGGTCNLAHTAPLYVRNGDEPAPVNREEIQYLLARTEALIQEVETGRREDGQPTTILTPDPETKQETLRLFRAARDVYAAKRPAR